MRQTVLDIHPYTKKKIHLHPDASYLGRLHLGHAAADGAHHVDTITGQTRVKATGLQRHVRDADAHDRADGRVRGGDRNAQLGGQQDHEAGVQLGGEGLGKKFV